MGGKILPGKGKEYMEKLSELTLALYNKCAAYALEKGIIIADTKFEFGLNERARSFWAMKCSRRTIPASGRWQAMKPARASRP